MSDDILANDPFWKILFKKMESSSKNIDKTKGSANKAKKMTLNYNDAIKEYFLFVTNWSEKKYDKHIEKRGQQLLKASEKFQEYMIKESADDSKISIEDIGALSLIPEYAELAKDDFVNWKGFDNMNDGTFARLFCLEFMSRMEMFYLLIGEAMKFAPITRLQDILIRRFNSDFSWAMAVAVLATQENLVKQKLIELGHTKDQIKEFLKEKGNNFARLVDLLAQEIEKKEKRKLTLSFYKSSTLREMRNTIEHEGFDIKITKEDANDILKDIEKFEKELFPETKN